jgi:hypothetical protein
MQSDNILYCLYIKNIMQGLIISFVCLGYNTLIHDVSLTALELVTGKTGLILS